MKTSKIKTFSIFGLWGEKDIRIPFEDDVKILVGDNGIGKSQVLSIIYHTLSGKWAGLTKYVFERLEIEVEGEERIVVSKENVWQTIGITSYYFEVFPIIPLQLVKEDIMNFHLDENNFYQFYQANKKNKSHWEQIEQIENLYFITDRLKSLINEEIKHRKNEIIEKKIYYAKVECYERINALFPSQNNIYLPTYRRVEEDFENIFYEKREQEPQDIDIIFNRFRTIGIKKNRQVKLNIHSQYINFSLEDVEKKIESLESQIDDIMKTEFPLLSNKMLKSLINGNGNKQEYDFTAEDVELSLHRTKDFLSEEEKNKIRELALNPNSEAAQKEKHTLDFLQQLVYLYRKQQPFDAAIKKWQSVCNRYMTDKEIVYDETLVKVELQTKQGKVLSLNQLSSGEKQLIGLFSQLYLSEGEQKYAIIFDEPEISMSVFWQENLLNDMLASGKCGFLLVATHSPFIFSGDLAKYAIGLHEYITPISPVIA